MKKECISIVCTFLALVIISPVFPALAGIKTDRKIIVIDPGHGGLETGAQEVSGTTEKDLVLELAHLLADMLNKDYTTLLTRTEDISLDIRERTALANAHKADLFISLHAKPDTVGQHGPTCYYYQPASEPAPADPTNKWESNQIPHQAQSRRAAEMLCSALDKSPDFGPCVFLGAPVAVLSGAGMPALLVEPLTLSDVSESADMSKSLLQDIARHMVKGIDAFFE